MLIRSPAIVLRMFPWSNTSKYVAWLTPEQGKLLTLIRGAQRPKSFFLGQLDLFYTCDLVWYAREHRSLHAAREAAPLHSRPRFRSDWAACAAASYAADVLYRALPFEAPAPGCFDLLARTLDALDGGGAPGDILAWHDLGVLDRLGFRPRIESCTSCGIRLVPDQPRSLSIGRGGFLCGKCADADSTREAVPVDGSTVAYLSALQRSDIADHLPATSPTARTSAFGILGRLLQYHLNLPLPSRTRAWEIIEASRSGSRTPAR
ncbi:MAG: DNA repair protein RecO [Kiritimatiellae bacterium]|nr:DNA repair protein RecO [Kiritimatiellia bacterium]